MLILIFPKRDRQSAAELSKQDLLIHRIVAAVTSKADEQKAIGDHWEDDDYLSYDIFYVFSCPQTAQ